MRAPRRLLLGLLLLPPLRAHAAGHWLIGRWEGEVSGGAGQEGPRRTMIVREVGPDGKCTGSWSFVGRGGTSADITVSDSEVRVLSGRANTYHLKRVGPDRLEGTYVTTGARAHQHFVWLQRVR